MSIILKVKDHSCSLQPNFFFSYIPMKNFDLIFLHNGEYKLSQNYIKCYYRFYLTTLLFEYMHFELDLNNKNHKRSYKYVKYIYYSFNNINIYISTTYLLPLTSFLPFPVPSQLLSIALNLLTAMLISKLFITWCRICEMSSYPHTCKQANTYRDKRIRL